MAVADGCSGDGSSDGCGDGSSGDGSSDAAVMVMVVEVAMVV